MRECDSHAIISHLAEARSDWPESITEFSVTSSDFTSIVDMANESHKPIITEALFENITDINTNNSDHDVTNKGHTSFEDEWAPCLY